MIVLYVFVAEVPAVLADCEPDPMAAGAIIGAVVFGVESFDGEPAFYADGHLMKEADASGDVADGNLSDW
jgi:hypothetical protein